MINVGSLPLGDSDDEKEGESADKVMTERMSLDSLYDERYSTHYATDEIVLMWTLLNSVYFDGRSSMGSAASRSSKNKSGNVPQGTVSAGRKSSVSTVRNGAQGRMGNNFESPVKDKKVTSAKKKVVVDDDDQSDDTIDMSAIPMDPNNQEESLESVEFDDFDALSPVDITATATAASRATSSKKRSSGVRVDSRANRRVSFGEGTKVQLEKQEREQERERELQDDMIVDDEITMISENNNDDYNDDDNDEGRSYSSSTGSTSESPERVGASKSRKSTASSSSSSTATPRSASGSRPKYSSVETPGSHEFVR